MRVIYNCLVILLLLSNKLQAQYCASSATSTADSRVENIQLTGNTITLNNNTSASGCVTYTDLTTGPNVPDLIQGNPYTINITQGTCGSNYGRTANAWIDFNQNNVFEVSEMLGAGTFSSNAAGYVHSYGFTVPGGAVTGNTTMRIIVSETGTCTNPCASYTWGETEDYTVDIQTSGPMAFVSSTVTQANTSNVLTCSNNQEVIGIEIVTSGSTSPFDVNSFRIRTNGSTSPAILTNISNMDLYYTGSSPTFNTSTLFGSAAPQLAGVNIDLGGVQTLAPGTNYFWLVYDINITAAVGNVIDAQCTRVTMTGGVGNQVPSVTSPAGSRSIAACVASPGGAGTANLSGWWKAGPLANGNVTSWTTSYPTGGSAITITDGSAPYSQCTSTPASGVFNYNTVVDFAGNTAAAQKYLANTSSINLLTNQNGGDEGTFFVVYAMPSVGNGDGVVTYKNGSHGIQMRGWGRLALGSTNSTNGTRNFTPSAANRPTVVSYKGNKSSATSMSATYNGAPITNTSASSAAMTAGLTFGAKQTGVGVWGEYFEGLISEVIFFNDDLSNSEIIQVNSYMAVKYGITLDNTGGGTEGDYVGSDAALLWDASANAGYHNDVIGLGRDDSQGLLQKQSHTFDDTTRIYRGTLQSSNSSNGSAISNNNSYVLIGDNGGQVFNTTYPVAEVPASCGLYSRLEREWKVTKSNFSDDFNIDVKISGNAIPAAISVSELRLLVDDDGDFSNGGTTCYYNGDGSGVTFSYSPAVITISNLSDTHIPNNSSRFFTIGSINEATPLPVEVNEVEAICKEGHTELSWSTSSEVNNDYFTIEKSYDGNFYFDAAVIQGQGNTSILSYYTWSDEVVDTKIAYYRIKQTDFDGVSSILANEVSQCSTELKYSLFPNPFEGDFKLSFEQEVNYPLKVELFDNVGRLVSSHQVDDNNSIIQVKRNIPPGTYLIKMSNESLLLVDRVIKTK